MKRKNSNALGVGFILILIGIIVYLLMQPPKSVEVPVPIHVPAPQPIYTRPIQPEYRDPPVKNYKPGFVQQMGVLLGENEETLPLYGKEVRGRRDQYHYYTSTPGNQI